MGNKGRPNKHQAATVEVVQLGNRIGYSGRCRCQWQSGYVRSTRESAAHDTQVHILEQNGKR